jgi:hypothetical protein
MDAPLYPPAQAWEEPVRLSQRLSTRDSSLADFLADPAARRIIESEIPDFAQRVGNPMLAPHLGNMAPRTMVQFGMFTADALDRVDARLALHYRTMGTGK